MFETIRIGYPCAPSLMLSQCGTWDWKNWKGPVNFLKKTLVTWWKKSVLTLLLKLGWDRNYCIVGGWMEVIFSIIWYRISNKGSTGTESLLGYTFIRLKQTFSLKLNFPISKSCANLLEMFFVGKLQGFFNFIFSKIVRKS